MSSSQSCEKYVRYSHDSGRKCYQKFRLSVNEDKIVDWPFHVREKRRECVTTLTFSFIFLFLSAPFSFIHAMPQPSQTERCFPNVAGSPCPHPSYHCLRVVPVLAPCLQRPPPSEGAAHVTSTRIAHVPLVRGGTNLLPLSSRALTFSFLISYLVYHLPIMLKLFLYFSLLK